jgi:hypothetical protein
LPALQKIEINKKGAVVELEFSTLENLLVKAKIKEKKIVNYFITKVPTMLGLFFVCIFTYKFFNSIDPLKLTI